MSADGLDDGGATLSLSSVVKEIQGLKDKFKREDGDSPSPFADLEKATVLQECRVFSDSRVVTESPRKCSQLITKLLHIVTQGDLMSSSEVTEVFFGVTKLFQSNDASLRRMVYFFIKEVRTGHILRAVVNRSQKHATPMISSLLPLHLRKT
jgi:coatomer protein complex subunit gamma